MIQYLYKMACFLHTNCWNIFLCVIEILKCDQFKLCKIFLLNSCCLTYLFYYFKSFKLALIIGIKQLYSVPGIHKKVLLYRPYLIILVIYSQLSIRMFYFWVPYSLEHISVFVLVEIFIASALLNVISNLRSFKSVYQKEDYLIQFFNMAEILNLS